MIRRLWIAAAVALFASGLTPRDALALDPGTSLTDFVLTEWRAPRPLPHDNVSAVLQTSDGYLWVGTVDGLARFDGVRAEIFNRYNTAELSNNWVTDLVEDKYGRLWIGTLGGGVVAHEAGRFRHFGLAEGLPGNEVMDLMVDGSGQLWAGLAGAGVVVYSDGEFSRPELGVAIPTLTVKEVMEDSQGRLWFGTFDGLYRRDRNGVHRFSTDDGLSDNRINALAERNGEIWAGTENGLSRWDGKIWKSFGLEDGLAHERIWTLSTDSDGNLWIATDGGGLQRQVDGRLDTLSTANGLPSDYVWAIEEDYEGNLWVATNGGGLVRLKAGRIKTLDRRDGLPSNFFWSVVEGPDGAIYGGTEDAGVLRFSGTLLRPELEFYPLADAARSLAAASDGTIWIGGNQGVHRIRNGVVEEGVIPGLRGFGIYALTEDENQTLWVATRTRGVFAWRNGRLESPPALSPLDRADVTALLLDARQRLWIGVAGGLHRLDSDKRLVSFTAEQGVPNSSITSLMNDGEGTIWASTRQGLIRLRNGKADTLTVANGLPDDAIMSLQPSSDGTVWMGGNRGLFSLPLATLHELADGGALDQPPRSYTEEDGLGSNEVNGSGASSLEDSRGRLWFVTRGGLAVLAPDHEPPPPPPPRVIVESIAVDGRALEGPSPWRLAAGIRRIDFRFTALSFRHPEAVRLQFRLDGFDSDWNEVFGERATHYTSLPPGGYSFRLRAMSASQRWQEGSAGLDFTIAPHWHERWLVRALILGGLLLLLWSGYRYQLSRLRGQKLELERLVQERTAEVLRANERLELMVREDALTGLANRRCLDEVLDQEWRRALRRAYPLSLLLIDVDFFKPYNDELGHQAGDECLKAIAGAMARAHQRAGELVARYGGEEFAVLMPNTPLRQAADAAEDLRQLVLDMKIPHPTSEVAAVVTISVGVASERPIEGDRSSDFFRSADQALYRAKTQGRNRTELSV